MRFPRTSSLVALLPPGIGGVFIISLAGCVSDNARREADSVKPAMPTIGPRVASPQSSIPESEILSTALRVAQNGDIPAAVRTLELAGERSERDRIAPQLVTALAAQNPTTAAAVALALPTGSAQLAAIEIAARALVQHDAGEALHWAMEISNPAVASAARRALADEWVRDDPRAALDRIRTLEASTARDEMLAVATSAWARRDASDALSWVRALPDGDLRQRLTSGVIFEIAQTNPDRALALAETLPAGRDRGLIFAAIAQTWIALDPKAAMAWAHQLPPGESREAALVGVETGLGAVSSRRTLVAPSVGVAALQPGANGGASVGWPELKASPAFAAWLATQSRVMSRDEAIVEFVRQRGSHDLGAIGNWVVSLPGGPGRQRAIETYFDEVLRGSPATAANWLRSVPGSDLNNDMIERAARQWLQIDPHAAATWLRDSTLPPDRKAELLRHAPR